MNMKKRLRLLSIFAALLLTLAGFAQQAVRGTLRSSTGEPLAGATVTVKGTNNSVQTNASGQFTINAPVGSTLVVSSVGYESRELAVTGAEMNETMTASASTMNEVVVIGYQSVRKKDLTGATS